MLGLFKQSTYHPTGNYISFDFVYKPEELLNEMRGGSYGDVADWEQPETYHNYASKFPCEEVAGALVYGTPAGIDKLKLSIEPLLQYGFWDDIITATRTVVAQPFSNVMGCGQCPGSVIWVSPEQSVLEACDTIYHEYLHNAGWTADPAEHEWIRQQAAKVRNYLAPVVGSSRGSGHDSSNFKSAQPLPCQGDYYDSSPLGHIVISGSPAFVRKVQTMLGLIEGTKFAETVSLLKGIREVHHDSDIGMGYDGIFDVNEHHLRGNVWGASQIVHDAEHYRRMLSGEFLGVCRQEELAAFKVQRDFLISKGAFFDAAYVGCLDGSHCER